MSKIKIIQPRQSARQPQERSQLPSGVDYCLFIVATAPDGFPVGAWIALTLPSMELLSIPASGYQPVWRLVSLLPHSLPAKIDDLKAILKSDHKVMSADRQTRQ